MPEIPDSLLLLFSSEIEQRNGRYQIEIPPDQVGSPDSAVHVDEQYRVAIIECHGERERATESGEGATENQTNQGPPVEKGEVRSVKIEAFGDQGDGIAKVERGYVLIVPGAEPGDELTVQIDEVRENVGFAEMISGER